MLGVIKTVEFHTDFSYKDYKYLPNNLKRDISMGKEWSLKSNIEKQIKTMKFAC